MHHRLIDLRSLADIHAAQRAADEAARHAELPDELRHRASLVATELARNVEVHSDGGWLCARSYDGCVELVVVDQGPGMDDLEACFVDGFSTAGTSGTGLGACRRLATRFDVDTRPHGTVCVAAFGEGEAPSPVGAFIRPFDGAAVSGDGYAVVRRGDTVQLVVVDGLGHGPAAAEATEAVLAEYHRVVDRSLSERFTALHEAARSTRGAAVTMVDISPDAVHHAGIGNVDAGVFTASGRVELFANQAGTVGYAMPSRIRVSDRSGGWGAYGERIIIHSDGLASSWREEGIRWTGSSTLHAAKLVRDHGRLRDDCVVVMVDLALPPCPSTPPPPRTIG